MHYEINPFSGNFDAVIDSLSELTTKDHNLLDGLSDDDHSQYALLAGRNGGQILIGSPDSGDNLTLKSNSSSDGLIIFGNVTTGMIFNEEDQAATIGGGSNMHTVNGSVENALFEFHQDGATGAGGTVYHRHSNTSGLSSDITFLKSRGDHDTPLIVADGHQLGHLRFAGYDGTDYALAAEISVHVDGTPGSDAMGGRICLKTSLDGTQTPTERMCIINNGFVGFGTDTPDDIIHASGTGNVNARIETTQVGKNAGYRMINLNQHWIFQLQGDDNDRFVIRDVTNTETPVTIQVGAVDNQLYLKAGGNVGIGTNAPGASLDVERTGEVAVIRAGTTDTNNASLKLRVDKDGTLGVWDFKVSGATHNFSFTEDDTYSPFIIESKTPTNTLYLQAITGNVGIGTDAPAVILDIVHTNAARIRMEGTNNNKIYSFGEQGGVFTLRSESVGANMLTFVDNTGMFFNADNENWDFIIEGDTDEYVRFDAVNHRVGIGTSTPVGKFHIDSTEVEALIVTKDADGGDIFIVDTLNNTIEIPNDNYKLQLGATLTDLEIYSNGIQGRIDTTDDLYIGCGTDKTIVLQEPVYNDLSLPLDSAKVPAANAPNWEIFRNNLNAFAYEVNDFQEFTQELLHDYKEGSTFQFHVHGALNAALAGGDETVKFEIEYSIADMDSSDGLGDVYPATTTISSEFTVPNGTADLTNIYIVVGTDATAAFKIGATIKGRVRRIASSGTELVGDIFLLSTNIHYEVDTMGSRTIADK